MSAVLGFRKYLQTMALVLLVAPAGLRAESTRAWPPVPLDWQGQGGRPSLLRLDTEYRAPDGVAFTAVIVSDGAGRLVIGIPDRADGRSLASVEAQANGIDLTLQVMDAEPRLRLQEWGIERLHWTELDLQAGEMVVLRMTARLPDTWTPYLEKADAPAWHRGEGPLFSPYWTVELDLRAADRWAGDSAEVRATAVQQPAPLPHLPVLQPGGWVRDVDGPIWSHIGPMAYRLLRIGLPALETESSVPADPQSIGAWLATSPGLTNGARALLADAIEARSGRSFALDAERAEWFQGRNWYAPRDDWSPDRLAVREQRTVEILRGRRNAPGAPPVAVAEKPPPPVAEEPSHAAQSPPEPDPPAMRPAPTARMDPEPDADPEDDATRALRDLGVPATVEETRAWIEGARSRGATRRDVKIVKNTYFARHGYVFQSPWLQEHFDGQPWYQPDEEAGLPALTPEENRIVEALQAFEREAKDGPVPAVRTASAPAVTPRREATGLPDRFLHDASEIPVSRQAAIDWVARARSSRIDSRAVRVTRNAVFALHGRSFRTGWLQEFFESRSWYRPDPGFAPEALDRGEREAVEILLAFERELRESPQGR